MVISIRMNKCILESDKDGTEMGWRYGMEMGRRKGLLFMWG